jgi:hypothetical protein
LRVHYLAAVLLVSSVVNCSVTLLSGQLVFRLVDCKG